MRYGNVDGKNKIYDTHGNLLHIKDDTVLFQSIIDVNAHQLLLAGKDKNIWNEHAKGTIAYSFMEFNLEEYGKNERIENEFIQKMEIEDRKTASFEHHFPSYVYATEKQIYCIRPPVFYKGQMWKTGNIYDTSSFFGDTSPSYIHQGFLQTNKLHDYSETPWTDIDGCIVSDVGLVLVARKELRPFIGLRIHFRRPVQAIHMKFLLELVAARKIAMHYTKLGTRRWRGLFEKFVFEDVGGLGRTYDGRGMPILPPGERVVSRRPCVPFVTMPVVMWNIIPHTKHAEMIRPDRCVLYETDKRLIFIRKMSKDDIQYREFPAGTHVIFSFLKKDAKTRTDKKGNVTHDIVFDKKNRVRVVIPADVNAYRRAYADHQASIVLVPELTIRKNEWFKQTAEG